MKTGTEPISGHRICPLCESTCGLLVELDGRHIVRVAPNPDDVLSAGHSCAKGLGLGRIEGDPDRIRTPLLRTADGGFREAGWDEAFAEIECRLPEFVAGDPGSCAIYHGNPAAHHLDATFYLGELIGALGTRNIYSPASVDTWPKNLAHMLLYGTGLGMSLPDLDRTDYLLILGSNPMVSNGSTVTAPGMHHRLQALRDRGGTLVVVDPVRTRTAEVADVHVAIRPGTDALFLLGVLSVVATEGLARPDRVPTVVDGLDDALAMAAEYTPGAVADVCGIDVDMIRDVARGFAGASAAVAHSRIGTCMQEFGTLANWLVEVLTIVTGNLDRPGGAMFALPPSGGQNTWPVTRPPKLMFDRWRSRVRGLPEAMGELPAVCFAEEILTPGPGRTRALITLAGNPARSLPNSGAIEDALGALEFMVSVDCYLNETTRHADVILPPPPVITRGHHDVTLNHFQIRNVARYTPPLLDLADGELAEWQILLRLAAIARGTPDRSVTEMDEEVAAVAARRAATLVGCEPERALRSTAGRNGPQRLLDLRLRSGPYGDRFGLDPDGLTLALLEDNPDGIDYGPLQPRIPEVLRTPNGRVDLMPEMITADLPRLRATMTRAAPDLLLINRRQRRGMNSWLHNALPQPDGGQCALLIGPHDAAERGLVGGDRVAVTSKVTTVTAELRIDDTLRPGVVSMPHGWGHDGPGLRTSRSASVPGSNYNALVDDTTDLEALTASPIFNGVPVTVTRTSEEHP
ncbi:MULTISPECIES: molybdopterin-dependent oxidoreductase [unclassified Rhodococcus (in: high G+C Gram-positive bacteria)]|uniref:molybdopterin-dependent oxidoreductase n=1 Tax=unclassified Rhodococcus (in: high G+C Gram-positive bacteria) TaxID=192944 RepID=UPI00163AF160|nr:MULTISPECIES: molybdopterin-dependent oxidoreductase [unclassified Rhodococcus (in: high G+C Gram-positive bacteria)]MBC2639477.1 molybdopterin-dependent oxidoreductase [Rhodococcus sp. 3A]MBC2895778.1 molybdopterin-dependent oxidoreductase [Rhodococcus sp. 4CII]